MPWQRPVIGVCLVFGLLLLFGQPARAVDPDKEADIYELIAIVDVVGTMKQVMAAAQPQMHVMIRQAAPEITDEQLAAFDRLLAEEFESAIPNMIVDFVETYDRHFDHEQIRDLLAFYRTPTGAHSLKVYPVIVAEGMAIGQHWGGLAGQRAGERLMEEIQQGL